MRYVDEEVIQRLIKGFDFAFLTTLAVALSIYFADTSPGDNRSALLGALAAVLGLSCLLVMRNLGLYRIPGLVHGMQTFLKGLGVVAVCGFTGFVAINLFAVRLSPLWFSAWFVFTFAYLAATRFAGQAWTRPIARAGRFRKRIAIVGGGKVAEEALQTLAHSRGLDIEIVGIFDDRFDERSPQSIQAHEKIGKISELADYARSNRVDLIIVAIPLAAEARLLHILKRLWELPCDIRISGKSSRLKFSSHSYTYLGQLPLLAVFDRPLQGWGLFLKNAIERALAAVAIAVFAPVMLAVAIAIRLESEGPIIFRQKRYGFNNELIQVFKFRSMYAKLTDSNATKLVTRDDPRVTKVGRFIRKTSLDELPQLFNVLTGQLSLVGPRPHATEAKAADTLYESVVDGYFARHKVRPGITGWAQVNGWRGETDTREKIEQRVKHDLEYIDQWSLMFDLYILFKTPFSLLKSEHAY
jgi:Undecaprenyl-phosphate glucose phosphotransferase